MNAVTRSRIWPRPKRRDKSVVRIDRELVFGDVLASVGVAAGSSRTTPEPWHTIKLDPNRSCTASFSRCFDLFLEGDQTRCKSGERASVISQPLEEEDGS
jgi:hypothetical protein